ncbi:MAG: hypothetical protein RL722_2375 [Pseudomonadota bacterium]|jgi:capsular polysaccharide export protein
MLNQDLGQFAGKRVLLLQGPVGPFFARLAADLRQAGALVTKVNFNLGDWCFYRKDALNYRGRMEHWPAWLDALLKDREIDLIFLFGDCRPIHQAARQVAAQRGIEVGVFEEGYVRPDYVTLERHGVNGYSTLSRLAEAYDADVDECMPNLPVGNAYWRMVWFGFLYFALGALGRLIFPHYRHHRPLSWREGWPWIRSVWRKHFYRWHERGQQHYLTHEASRRYFLVPLQVHNDAQVRVHSPVQAVSRFIAQIVESFAAHAPKDAVLVFKHHPMDRGYSDYRQAITVLAAQHGISKRVRYIHDQHLPTLLDHARGVIVINSTVGLSAIHHGAPTLTCGNALYDMPGLTFQGSMAQFWTEAAGSQPDRELYNRFRRHLIFHTQLNGSFYSELKSRGTVGGLLWGDRSPAIDSVYPLAQVVFRMAPDIDRQPAATPLAASNQAVEAKPELAFGA